MRRRTHADLPGVQAEQPTAGQRRGLGKRLAARIPDLLRDRAFRRYWSGQTVSLFGDQISSIALPLLAVLVLRASPAQMGFLAALLWLPSLLFGLHAGAWVDRRGKRRRTMIGADLCRAVLLASIPVSYAFGVLTLWQLYGVALGVGLFSVLFTVSDPSLFVSLVPDDRYVEGNSLIYGSRALSFVGGPSVGGALVQFLTAPLAVLADAASFVGSAFFLARIHPEEPPAAEPGKGTLTAGARFIKDSAIVRASLSAVAVINFFNFVFFALFVLYATRYLHVAPGLLGLVLGIGAIGGVLGALVTKRLAAWLGVGRVYTISCLVFTAPLVLVPLAGGPRLLVLGMLMAAEFISGFGVMVLDISVGAIFSAVIPDHLRSRVSGAFQAVNYGTRPLGALAGGFLGTLIGLRPTLWIAAIGGMTGFLLLLPTPLPRFRMPAGSPQEGQRAAPASPGSQELADNPT
ncbi:MAG TPA: MFS transporter [Streptosporangiaceae bacterium]|nr:MFS transporter [Streptosporangiaceae bacterium]